MLGVKWVTADTDKLFTDRRGDWQTDGEVHQDRSVTDSVCPLCSSHCRLQGMKMNIQGEWHSVNRQTVRRITRCLTDRRHHPPSTAARFLRKRTTHMQSDMPSVSHTHPHERTYATQVHKRRRLGPSCQMQSHMHSNTRVRAHTTHLSYYSHLRRVAKQQHTSTDCLQSL